MKNSDAAIRDSVPAWLSFGGVFDLPALEKRLQEIEALETSSSFWDDASSAQKTVKEKNGLEKLLATMKALEGLCDDTGVLIDFVKEEESEATVMEAVESLNQLEERIQSSELQQMLSDPNDKVNAIVTIHAGAGGTEAQDWAQMLLRMYLRYCEQREFKIEILDQQSGEEAGIKSATFLVEGDYAFGYLKAESGVHRLVRISPFDSNKRRHTSFASVFVYADLDDTIEIEILDKDLRVDTYRSGGAGGQSVNKTDSAVRLTHLPSGIVVQCQSQRSQHQNREAAMKVLKARLYEKELQERQKEKQALEDSKKEIAWGSQIRSYVLHPYRMVKDHRTNFEVGDVDAVLDGRVQGFIESYLFQESGKGKA